MGAYCRCRKFSFETAHKESAPADWQAELVWVCGECGKISHAIQEVVVQVRGPAGVKSLQHAKLLANGQSLLTWATPNGSVDTIEYITYPRKVSVTDNQPLIYKAWILLMTKVDIILAPPEGPGDNELQAQARDIAKHQARGIAEVLALLMAPFMDDADMVVKAATKKYKDFTYEVPGLGEHLWDPTKNPDGTPRTPMPTMKEAQKRAAARPKVDNKSTKKLSAEEALGIRNAVGSGMFTEEDIAAMFKVSVATVKEAVSAT